VYEWDKIPCVTTVHIVDEDALLLVSFKQSTREFTMKSIQNNDSHNVIAIFGEDGGGDSTSVIEAQGQSGSTSRSRVYKLARVVRKVMNAKRRMRGYLFYIGHVYETSVMNAPIVPKREDYGQVHAWDDRGKLYLVSKHALEIYARNSLEYYIEREVKYLMYSVSNHGSFVKEDVSLLTKTINRNLHSVTIYLSYLRQNDMDLDQMSADIARSKAVVEAPMAMMYRIRVLVKQTHTMLPIQYDISKFDGRMIEANYLYAIELITDVMLMFEGVNMALSDTWNALNALRKRFKRWRKLTKRYCRWILYHDHLERQLRTAHTKSDVNLTPAKMLDRLVHFGSCGLTPLYSDADSMIWQELGPQIIPNNVAIPDVAQLIMSYMCESRRDYDSFDGTIGQTQIGSALGFVWRYTFEYCDLRFGLTRYNGVGVLCNVGINDVPALESRHDNWSLRLMEPWMHDMPGVNDKWGCECRLCNSY
jgi:hypothetical protein